MNYKKFKEIIGVKSIDFCRDDIALFLISKEKFVLFDREWRIEIHEEIDKSRIEYLNVYPSSGGEITWFVEGHSEFKRSIDNRLFLTTRSNRDRNSSYGQIGADNVFRTIEVKLFDFIEDAITNEIENFVGNGCFYIPNCENLVSLQHTTEKAICINDVWFPKTLVTHAGLDENGYHTLNIADWVINQKGIDNNFGLHDECSDHDEYDDYINHTDKLESDRQSDQDVRDAFGDAVDYRIWEVN